MDKQVIISEFDYYNSMYSTIEWESSVFIIKWEHNFITHMYIIDYEEKIELWK